MTITVTEASIKSKISDVYYINAGEALTSLGGKIPRPAHAVELGLVTICIIIMDSGFKVEGTSACVDPNNYNKELGEKYAYENAFEKLWQLEGYVLKQKLSEDK